MRWLRTARGAPVSVGAIQHRRVRSSHPRISACFWPMADLNPIDSMVFDTRAGVVLAPYEALLAQIMWTAESVRRGDSASYFQEAFRSPPRVAPQMKRRILMAYLLFGPLDAVSGLFLPRPTAKNPERPLSRARSWPPCSRTATTWAPFATPGSNTRAVTSI